MIRERSSGQRTFKERESSDLRRKMVPFLTQQNWKPNLVLNDLAFPYNSCILGVRWSRINILDMSWLSSKPTSRAATLEACLLAAMTLFLASLLTNLQMIGLGLEREESRKGTLWAISMSLIVMLAPMWLNRLTQRLLVSEASSLAFSSGTPRILMLKA